MSLFNIMNLRGNALNHGNCHVGYVHSH